DVYSIQDGYASPVEPTPAMTFAQFGLTSFDMQYWTGTQWQTVPGGSITGNNLVWRRVQFFPVTTPRIRVLVTGALAGYSRIAEVEAYRSGGSASVPGPFTKTSPPNGATQVSPINVALAWQPSVNATSYEFCVDTTNNNACDTLWTSTATLGSVLSAL